MTAAEERAHHLLGAPAGVVTVAELGAWLTAARAEALEEAARAMCPYCARGAPVRQISLVRFVHEGAADVRGDCKASPIRALTRGPATEEPKP